MPALISPLALSTSKPNLLVITQPDADHSLLPAPAITQATDGQLDLGSFSGDAHIRITPWPLIAAGQRVWLTIEGTDDAGKNKALALLTSYPLTTDEAAKGLNETIRRAEIEDFKNETIIICTLRVSFDGSGNPATQVTFPRSSYTIIKAADDFYIDPAVMSITVGETAERKAQGGRPPYGYTSSNVTVASVDGNGIVTAGNVGNTTITANDSASPSRRASYGVQVISRIVDPSGLSQHVGLDGGRTGTGGTPPYSYRSANGNIARHVAGAASHMFLAWKEGSTVITVTDARGATGSYTFNSVADEKDGIFSAYFSTVGETQNIYIPESISYSPGNPENAEALRNFTATFSGHTLRVTMRSIPSPTSWGNAQHLEVSGPYAMEFVWLFYNGW